MSRIEMLGGGRLPDGLAALLGAALSDHDASMKPATKEQLAALLEGAKQPKLEVGDIVVLRENACGNAKWPQPGERVIVTQVLDTPYRSGEHSSGRSAIPSDIALAFICDEGHIHEFLYDSREFVKVGSINE